MHTRPGVWRALGRVGRSYGTGTRRASSSHQIFAWQPTVNPAVELHPLQPRRPHSQPGGPATRPARGSCQGLSCGRPLGGDPREARRSGRRRQPLVATFSCERSQLLVQFRAPQPLQEPFVVCLVRQYHGFVATLGLLRHGDRRLEGPRDRLDGKLPPTVLLDVGTGILGEAVASLTGGMVPRLRVHPDGWQSRLAGQTAYQRHGRVSRQRVVGTVRTGPSWCGGASTASTRSSRW